MKYINFRLYIFHGHNNRKTAGDVQARNPAEAAQMFMLEYFENGKLTEEPKLVAVRESNYDINDHTQTIKWCALTTIHKKRLYITCNSNEYQLETA